MFKLLQELNPKIVDLTIVDSQSGLFSRFDDTNKYLYYICGKIAPFCIVNGKAYGANVIIGCENPKYYDIPGIFEYLPEDIQFTECHGYKCRIYPRDPGDRVICRSCYGDDVDVYSLDILQLYLKSAIPYSDIADRCVVDMIQTEDPAVIKNIHDSYDQINREIERLQRMQSLMIQTISEEEKERYREIEI